MKNRVSNSQIPQTGSRTIRGKGRKSGSDTPVRTRSVVFRELWVPSLHPRLRCFSESDWREWCTGPNETCPPPPPPPGWDSNRGHPVWESVVLSTWPQQLLIYLCERHLDPRPMLSVRISLSYPGTGVNLGRSSQQWPSQCWFLPLICGAWHPWRSSSGGGEGSMHRHTQGGGGQDSRRTSEWCVL